MDATGSAEWRAGVKPDARLRIVNKIVETLQRQLPIFRGQNLGDLKNIAVRFEEKMFASAKNQMDYLGKISLKMLTVEAKTRHFGFANEMASSPSDQSHSSSDSTDFTGQTGRPGSDWQEEIYQKVQSMRNLYYEDLCEARQKIIQKWQQHESPAPSWMDAFSATGIHEEDEAPDGSPCGASPASQDQHPTPPA